MWRKAIHTTGVMWLASCDQKKKMLTRIIQLPAVIGNPKKKRFSSSYVAASSDQKKKAAELSISMPAV